MRARYQAWADTAIAPEIVKAIYFVEARSRLAPYTTRAGG